MYTIVQIVAHDRTTLFPYDADLDYILKENTYCDYHFMHVLFNIYFTNTNALLIQKVSTVDREIFTVKKFSPVAWAAKIKRTKIFQQ